MSYQIDGTSRIADIIINYPQTVSVFKSHGFGALTTEDGMRVLAPFLKLETALRSRGIDKDAFIGLLMDAAEDEYDVEAPGLESYENQKDLTLLALMPCGLKMPFSKSLTVFLKELEEKENLKIRYAVEGNVNQELSYYSYIQTIEKAEEMPDIVVSADFNAFYGKKFYDSFVATGEITGYKESTPCKSFEDAGIMDPLKEYTVLGINPLVMVANLEEIKGRELPRSWEDMLKPEWEKSVVLRGNGQFFCHAVLLPVYQKFGAEGLRKLAANVLTGLHPAQMVKQIDSGADGAIYVMPEFFAHRVRKKDRMKIIWPDDGALASPVTLQVKRSRIDDLKPVLDFLTSSELAGKLNNARFPVPHADIESEIQEKPLLWPGWDFFRNKDLLEVNNEIDNIFMPLVKKTALILS